jgi:hypothetical protein
VSTASGAREALGTDTVAVEGKATGLPGGGVEHVFNVWGSRALSKFLLVDVLIRTEPNCLDLLGRLSSAREPISGAEGPEGEKQATAVACEQHCTAKHGRQCRAIEILPRQFAGDNQDLSGGLARCFPGLNQTPAHHQTFQNP